MIEGRLFIPASVQILHHFLFAVYFWSPVT